MQLNSLKKSKDIEIKCINSLKHRNKGINDSPNSILLFYNDKLVNVFCFFINKHTIK